MINWEQEVETIWNGRNKKTYTEKGYIFTKYGDKFTIKAKDLTLSSTAYIEVICDYCGCAIKRKMNNQTTALRITKEHRHSCKICRITKTADIKRFSYNTIKEVIESRGYKIVSESYTDSNEKIKFECPKHGLKEVLRGNIFNLGQGCNECATNSKGEIKIRDYLDNNKISHASEYTFDNLISLKGGKLRFDFAIFDNSNKLTCLIEYDGAQHFHPVDFAGKGDEWADDQFIIIQSNDKLKDDYCKLNNIKLIRISYVDFSILDNILSREIVGDQP